jgi:hypothetical protein
MSFVIQLDISQRAGHSSLLVVTEGDVAAHMDLCHVGELLPIMINGLITRPYFPNLTNSPFVKA